MTLSEIPESMRWQFEARDPAPVIEVTDEARQRCRVRAYCPRCRASFEAVTYIGDVWPATACPGRFALHCKPCFDTALGFEVHDAC